MSKKPSIIWLTSCPKHSTINMDNSILTHIAQAEQMAYAICNAEREITHHSASLAYFATPEVLHYIPDQNLVGQRLEYLFDELVGLEEDLDLVQTGQLSQLRIEMTARTLPDLTPPVQYLTLKIDPFEQGMLLLTIFDVTQQGLLAQKLMQQRNEFYLMLNRLHFLHSEMDSVLSQFLSFNASLFRQPPPPHTQQEKGRSG